MQCPILKPKFKFTKPTEGSNPIQIKYSIMKQDSKLNSVVVNGRTYSTYFSSRQLSKIYNCPTPNYSKSVTIGVISLGGGLVGKLNNNVLLPNGKVDSNSGTLTNGDIQAYWNWQGIPSSNWPTVIIKSVDGTKNTPSSNPYSANYGATIENTLDVETIGSWCSSSNVTIIMYLAQNNNFYGAVSYAINSNVIANNCSYKPSIISISWGAPEPAFGQSYVSNFNILCSNAAYRGINICVASGDSYSQDGLNSNAVDFPSSSAWVTACGGTSLKCPGNVYTNSTVETVWSNPNGQGGTGGGVSIYISKPSYQSNVTQSRDKRCIPDISFNSDPYTGLVYYINGKFMEGIGGTSTAAPAMAGLIACLNLSTFVNPFIYKMPSYCFHDITSGNNSGYNAAPGYDLCTGRGSIHGLYFASSINTLSPQKRTNTIYETMAHPYYKHNKSTNVSFESLISPSVPSPYFNCKQLASIYGCPPPPTSTQTIGVISLGGGLFGSLSPTTGILTGGDVHAYWTSLGIPASNQPKVVIKTLGVSTNMPSSNPTNNNYGATVENTVDVETIGSWYPSSNLTIIMYLANQYVDGNAFYNVLDYAINSNVVIGTTTYTKPNVISISWGFPELSGYTAYINSLQSLLSKAASSNINIFCATGDNGSTDGIPGTTNYTDFPSCSPSVIACGGTTLVCPNDVYDSSTSETTWTGSGGGISRIFSKPTYQSNITQSLTKRCTPDISLNANPQTGMYYIIGGKVAVIGGTSTVSPAMAAFTSILKINYFLNTKIYTINAQSFHDITSGNNGGYNASSGYDLCSGRGSLNGVKFIGFLNPVPTTGITLNPRNSSIKIGTVIQLTATVAPQNATNQLVNWSSSKPNIVSVSSSGLCTARSVGSSVITASQGNIRATTNISVKLRLTTKNITIEKDKSCIVKLTSDSKDYLLTNNSESIVNCVCIDGSWKLTGKELGEANILIDYIDSDEAGILVVNVV
jgi:subtilase family serine protease